MYGKLLLVTLCIFASGIENCHGTASALLCPYLQGSVFGIPCTLDVTNTTINTACNRDCYCAHGAYSGGACAKTSPLKADCLCDYTVPATALDIDCSTNPTNTALALECGPNAVGLTLPVPLPLAPQVLTGLQVCALECQCLHGGNGGNCTYTGVATVNDLERCKCIY